MKHDDRRWFCWKRLLNVFCLEHGSGHGRNGCLLVTGITVLFSLMTEQVSCLVFTVPPASATASAIFIDPAAAKPFHRQQPNVRSNDIPLWQASPYSVLLSDLPDMDDAKEDLLRESQKNTPTSRWWKYNPNEFQTDRVVRVLEDESQAVIKLEKAGLVSLSGIQLPQSYDSSCSYYTTSNAKLRQLLPRQTNVRVKLLNDDSRGPRKAVILSEETPSKTTGSEESGRRVNVVTVQEQLIRRGYAKVSTQERARRQLDGALPGLLDQWQLVEQQARDQNAGPLYQKTCKDGENVQGGTAMFSTDSQFEELEFTIQTDWREDGGRPRRQQRREEEVAPPPNPGDTKGCSDFRNYEEALRWYEKYYPFYGDVAKLDRNNDGVPCPGLPHTKDPDRYRMKIPNERKQL